MLIRFEVANFRSILEPVELSMVAVDADRTETRPIPNLGRSLLTVAAIFGPNASGKSNLIAAVTWLRDSVQNSLRFWDDEIPIEPFAFGDGRGRSTDFTIESVVGGVRFEYVLELARQEVLYEALFHYPEKKRRRVFERHGEGLKFQRGLGSLSGTRELLTPRTLALSVARRFDEPLVSGFAHDLLRTQVLGLTGRPQFLFVTPPPTAIRWFEEPSPDDHEAQGNRAQALALLRMADLGIDDVVIEDEQVLAGESHTERRIRLIHRNGAEQAPLDYSAESEGTRTWFHLIGPALTALQEGSLLLFDELDASLHPTLSSQLIELFHNPKTNPLAAQLVFTSHDTSLLNHLNRDEIWLTEKSDHGATRLGALAEFAGGRVRASKNLEKAYVSGRFGALPDVDRTELLRSLGLIG